MFDRISQEKAELERLSKYAAKSINSKGRSKPLEPCPLRTEYQRDRDRIVHSKAFRRLKYKTQVFISPRGDHYRTRLTHTIEVSQISRTIARALRLNEDLTEAIAMGHDLGHTPFGHTGEAIISQLLRERGREDGFSHYTQSIRIADIIEDLNLTYEVKDGIGGHSSGSKLPDTLEGQIVRIADRIAYINHDIDDAIRSGILSKDDLPKEYLSVLGDTHGDRISTMVLDMAENSWDRPTIRMSPEIESATMGLRKFLFENFYLCTDTMNQNRKAQSVVKALFEYYEKHQDKIPPNGVEYKDNDIQKVVDYVASMTDRFAIAQYEELFLPSPWGSI